jgi:5-methyltetrahydrofolate--homocysteine methyltransferase
MDILTKIQQGVLILDSAMGTALQAHGLKGGEVPELWNFSQPEVVREIHQANLAAGAMAVTTNTFGANRLKIDDVSGCIKAAVNLAREAANQDAFVLHDIGPSGKLMKPAFELSFEEAYDIYREQVIAGQEAGADAHIFETFTDIGEIRAGVLAAKETSD